MSAASATVCICCRRPIKDRSTYIPAADGPMHPNCWEANKAASPVYAVRHAISILVCEDARRRGVEPSPMALADMHRALRNLSEEAAGELVENLNVALDILSEGKS